MIADPGFVDPTAATDNFNIANYASSPAKTIGFVPFNYSLAGRVSAPLPAPPGLSPVWPLQLRPLSSFY